MFGSPTCLKKMIRGRSLRPGDRAPSVRHFSEQQRAERGPQYPLLYHARNAAIHEARPKSGFFVRARLADLVRGARCCAEKPKVSNLANLDPLDSLLSDHSDPKLVPLGVALPSVQLRNREARSNDGDARSPGWQVARSASDNASVAPLVTMRSSVFKAQPHSRERRAISLRSNSLPGATS